MENKIDQYFQKKFIQKKGTINTYRTHIEKYFTINHTDPNTYFDTPQPTTDHITTYYQHLLQNYAPKTRQTAISSIKNFLQTYDTTIQNLTIWDDIKQRQKRNGGSHPTHQEYVPDIDEIKTILHHTDIRTKAVIMMAMSSGMRISEITQLDINDLYLKEKPPRINIRGEIAKGGKRRTTFITPETRDILQEWIRIKDTYVENSRKSLNFKNVQHIKTQHDNRLFPFHPNRIRETFNKACDKAGYTDKETIKGAPNRQRRTLHYHNLRKFFRTYLGNVDLAETLMGHSGYLSVYRNYNDKQLAQKFMDCMDNLTIYDRDVTGIRQQLKDQQEQLRKLEEERNNILDLVKKLIKEKS